MTDKIREYQERIKREDIVPVCKAVEYDPTDTALPEPIFNAKRIVEYILAQDVYIDKANVFTGMLRYDKANVPADFFHRKHHKAFSQAISTYYRKYIDNLVSFEWQHSAPDYERIITKGIESCLENVRIYKEKYGSEKEKFEFLQGEEIVLNGIISWANKCADEVEKTALITQDEQRKRELLEMARVCRKVPLHPCDSFYEAVHCIIFCFQFLPDSVGTIDRYLLPYYKKDVESGKITQEQAKDYLQELFIHLCNHTPFSSVNADRTAECHFAIGGYDEFKNDSFSETSKLIVDSLMEMDTRRPAISLRWTKKTPFSVLKYCLECEKNDKNKRIAFVSDEPRIQALIDNCGLTFAEACRYSMVGCNEPAFPGMAWYGGCSANIARSLTTTLYEHSEEVIKAKTFDEFYDIYHRELKKDLDLIIDYMDKFNDIRSKDCNVLSSWLIDGCIESGIPVNQGGGKYKFCGPTVMGVMSVIDSLTVIKQFVYDEKTVSMQRLIEVLKSDWSIDPTLRTKILKTGKFFGNNEEVSNQTARKFTTDLWEIVKDRKLKIGASLILGTQTGYNPHNAQFGKRTKATPDGRKDGDVFMIGVGNNNGKDREGLTNLLISVAQMDPKNILTGATVNNVLIDKAIIDNDEYFEKYCKMIERYFQLGGIHLQPNYVSKQDLINARNDPEKYSSLKVRVSGFSATFVSLNGMLQEEIIQRTEQKIQ